MLMRRPRVSYQQALVACADVAAFGAAYVLAFLLRFDFRVPHEEWTHCLETVWLVAGLQTGTFAVLGAYRGLWRYASISDLATLLKSLAVSQVPILAAVLLIHHGFFPRSVLFIQPVLALLAVGLVRYGIRATRDWRYHGDTEDLPRVLIFGAGDHGEHIVRDMQRRRRKTHHIVGFVDDDRAKWHHDIHGLPILGGRQALAHLATKHRVDEVVVAVEHSRGQLIKELMDLCKSPETRKVQFLTVPTIEETLRRGSARHPGIRKIELSDLLPRKSVHTDLGPVRGLLRGRTVLVTGAGGTIGAELSRQILRFKPAKLLLLEKHNTGLFYIDRELSAVHSSTLCLPIAGDIGDATLLENLFQAHRPDLVFHAAAHKHVPLMESNPQEAVQNNTLGTHLLAETAARHGAERFLYISTDKAVRPTSVMGASKRLGEMVLRALGGASGTKFISVRFGNVLGSSGSAINIFKEQIAGGGPLTVTHPDMTRYFMTQEEAIQLILQAAALGGGGEIFVLNMGDPVKVVDVARNLILLSGLEPEKDIKIVFTGLRPGEKMFEELFRDNDLRMDTGHPDIFAAKSEEADLAVIRDQLARLRELCVLADAAPLLAKVRELVPSFRRSPDGQPAASVKP